MERAFPRVVLGYLKFKPMIRGFQQLCGEVGLWGGLLLLALTSPCRAGSVPVLPDSPYLIDAWESDDGLPENSATSMVQTPDGYLWFGTFNGLVRFDGIRFTVFDRSNTPELPSAAVSALHLDRHRRLWIGTDRGIARVGADGWRTYGPAEGFSGSQVRRFAESPEGALAITCFNGNLFRLESERLVALPLPPLVSPLSSTCFFGSTGVLWAAGPGFLGTWNGEAWVPAPGEPWSEWTTFDSACPGESGDVWVCLRTAVVQYRDGVLQRRIALDPPATSVWDMRQDADGVLWMACDLDGLRLVSPDGQSRHFAITNGLTYNSLRFSRPDREGNVWVGSSGGGLMRFKRRHFVNYGLAAGLPNQVAKSVAEVAPGTLLIGTHGGGPALVENDRVRPLDVVDGQRPVSYVWSVLADPDGMAWLGTFGQGLHRYDGRELRAVETPAVPGRVIHALFRDSKDRVWIGGDRGIGRYDGQTVIRLGRAEGITATSFRAFAEDPASGAIWAGSYDGGLWQNGDGDSRPWRRLAGLPTDQIWSLLADRNGVLWVGTFGMGLCRVVDGQVFRYTEAHGLPDLSVASLIQDGAGFLWIGSNRGIYRVDREALMDVADGRRERLNSHGFNLSDGLPTLECSGGYQPSACRDASGRLWFATLKGVVCVDPMELELNLRPPAVALERFVVNRKSLLESGIDPGGSRAMVGPITLPPDSRQIEIHYAGLSFAAPDKIRFQTRLDGFDDTWREVGDLRVAYFTDLRPGSYVFRVRAANSEGVWNTEGGSLAFSVTARAWQTWWFRGMGLIALMTATGVVSRWMLNLRLHSRLNALEHQRKLSLVQARLASVLENTNDFVGFFDPASRVLYINAAGRRLVGLPPDADVSRLTLGDLCPDGLERNGLSAPWTDGVRRGPWQGEAELRHQADGGPIPVSLVLLAHRRWDGALDYVSAIARDRTAEKRSEELLRRENAFRESIIRKAGDGICVFGWIAEPPGVRFTVWNDQMTQLTGMTLDDINRHGWQALVPDDPAYRERAGVRLEGVAQGRDLVQDEWQLRRPDGSSCFVLVSTGLLSGGAAGESPLVLAVLHDITGRKTAEAASEQQRLRLSGIINAAMDAIITLDEVSRIVVFNPAAERMFQRSAGDLIGQPIDSLFPPTSLDRLTAVVGSLARDVLASRRLEDPGTVLGRRADGTDFPMEVTVSCVPLATHSFSVLTCRDVTDLRIAEAQRERLETQLRQAQKMEAIGTLAGGIAHDFNNMLGVILGYAELARLDLGSTHPSLRCLDEVVQASQRAKRLVQQILAFSRKQAPSRRLIHLGPVISESVALLRATLPTTVAIVRDLDPDTPRVLADRTQIEQVMINLCTNAWQAMAGGVGSIRITLKPIEVGLDLVRQQPGLRQGLHARLTVTDDGCGMDGPTQERIFDPFFTTKGHGLGTGLGLSIVHGIIKNHDATIAVESRPGFGTTFTLFFPAVQRGAEEPEPVEVPLFPGHGRKVLFLDDERALMELGRRTMEHLGYQVEAFDDPTAALAAFKRDPGSFDVVLTDLSMPGRSGVTIATEVLGIRPGVPVILCSGHMSETMDQEARALGVGRLLLKPYSPAELSQALSDVLAPRASPQGPPDFRGGG